MAHQVFRAQSQTFGNSIEYCGMARGQRLMTVSSGAAPTPSTSLSSCCLASVSSCAIPCPLLAGKGHAVLVRSFLYMLGELVDVGVAEFRAWLKIERDSEHCKGLLEAIRSSISCVAFAQSNQILHLPGQGYSLISLRTSGDHGTTNPAQAQENV